MILAQAIFFHFTKENMVTQELAAHDDMQRIAASESLPRYKSLDVVSNILLKHSEILHQTSNNLDQNSSPMLYADSAKLLKSYKKELNFKVSLRLSIVWKSHVSRNMAINLKASVVMLTFIFLVDVSVGSIRDRKRLICTYWPSFRMA